MARIFPPLFSLGLTFKEKLGNGSFGEVAHVLHEGSGTDLAVKVICNTDNTSELAKQTAREVTILYAMNHLNILTIHGVRLEGKMIHIFTEYCEYDLQKLTYPGHKSKNMHKFLISSPLNYLNILQQMLDAIDYMHSLGIIHRDIKPANVLVDSNFTVKLCDFGFARSITDEKHSEIPDECLTEYMVTRWYRAPEVVLNPGRYGKAQDIWSIGCTFAELIMKSPIFKGKDCVHQLDVILEARGTLSDIDMDFDMPSKTYEFLIHLNKRDCRGSLESTLKPHTDKIHRGMFHLMKGMFEFNPSLRLTAKEVLSSSVFCNIFRPTVPEKPISTVNASNLQKVNDLNKIFSNLKGEKLFHTYQRAIIDGTNENDTSHLSLHPNQVYLSPSLLRLVSNTTSKIKEPNYPMDEKSDLPKKTETKKSAMKSSKNKGLISRGLKVMRRLIKGNYKMSLKFGMKSTTESQSAIAEDVTDTENKDTHSECSVTNTNTSDMDHSMCTSSRCDDFFKAVTHEDVMCKLNDEDSEDSMLEMDKDEQNLPHEVLPEPIHSKHINLNNPYRHR